MNHSESDLILNFISDCYLCNSIHDLMHIAFKYFENPCVLMDKTYKTLGHIGGENLSDPTWYEIVNDKRFSIETLLTFVDEGLIDHNMNMVKHYYTPTIFDSGHALNVRRLSISIPSETGVPNGWFTVFEHDRPFSETDSQLLTWLA